MDQKGFTLPELLVVGAITTIMLLLTVLVARPENFSKRQVAAERLTAVAEQMIDLSAYAAKAGALPEGLPEKAMPIGSEPGMVDLCAVLVPDHAKDIVYDPVYGLDLTRKGCREDDAMYITGMEISKTKDNRVTIAAGLEGEKVSLTKKF